MDDGTCLPEKQRGDGRHHNGDILQVEFKPLDWSNRPQIMSTAELYFLFAEQVNGEDTSGLLDFDVGGSKVQVIEAEARLYGYKSTGCHVQIALVGGSPAGFLIYHQMFDKIICVRCLFCEPWSQGLKLAKGIVDSIQPTPTHIIFQTRKDVPPERLIGLTRAHQRVIAEDEYFFTRIMEWRNGIRNKVTKD